MQVCKLAPLGTSSEHRVGVEPTFPRYDGGILPLDDQCLFPLEVGPQGFEPRPVWLRASDAAITPRSHSSLLSQVGAAGVEPAT